MSKIRLDQLVFDKGYADSREKAKAIIMSGCVFIDGQRADFFSRAIARTITEQVSRVSRDLLISIT